jgi:hypothetical protein
VTVTRLATQALRLLRRRRPTVPADQAAPAFELAPSVCRALAQATTHERPGDDERHPRTVVSVPGSQPFLAGDGAATAEALRARFPKELPSPNQADIAARFLADALRQRRRAQKPGTKWTTSW